MLLSISALFSRRYLRWGQHLETRLWARTEFLIALSRNLHIYVFPCNQNCRHFHVVFCYQGLWWCSSSPLQARILSHSWENTDYFEASLIYCCHIPWETSQELQMLTQNPFICLWFFKVEIEVLNLGSSWRQTSKIKTSATTNEERPHDNDIIKDIKMSPVKHSFTQNCELK